MKAIDVNNPYVRTKVLTASPAELRMMLLEGAVRFMREGREGLTSRDYERVYEGFSQARAILTELVNGLRDDVDAALCARLRGLYLYMYRLLVDASFEKSVEKADEAIGLMEFEVETWAMVLEKLRAEGGAEPATPVQGSTVGGEGPRAPLSVEG